MDLAKAKLDKRLDFLLDSGDMEQARIYQDEYTRNSNELRKGTLSLREERDLVVENIAAIKSSESRFSLYQDSAKEVQKCLDEKGNPIDLRSIYKKFFDCIVVKKADEAGYRPVHFYLSDSEDYNESSAFPNVEDVSSTWGKMVGPPGLEPGTNRL